MNGVRGQGVHEQRTCARCPLRWYPNDQKFRWSICPDCRSVVRLMGDLRLWQPDAPELQSSNGGELVESVVE